MSTVKNTGLLKVTYIVNSVFSSRTYILSLDGHKDFWLVDCGSTPLIMERLTAMSGGDFRVNGVLLTHAHYDHIYGLPSLKELFPDVNVYTNEAGREALADERRNMSKYHGDPIVFKETMWSCVMKERRLNFLTAYSPRYMRPLVTTRLV